MQIKNFKKIFFSKNKKGDVKISLEELIGALLAVMIIFIIVYVAARLSGAFFSNKDYDSVMASFDVLGERLDGLIKDKNYANTNLLYFLGPNYILVGFNYNDKVEMKTCEGGIFEVFKESESLAETRRKVSSLCDKACLCIFKGTFGKDFDENYKEPQIPLNCKSFDKNIVFLAPKYQDNFCSVVSGWHPGSYQDYYQVDREYQFLILKGFDTEEVYLDKYESDDGKIFIFLGVYKDNPEEPIYKRKQFMEGKYEK